METIKTRDSFILARKFKNIIEIIKKSKILHSYLPVSTGSDPVPIVKARIRFRTTANGSSEILMLFGFFAYLCFIFYVLLMLNFSQKLWLLTFDFSNYSMYSMYSIFSAAVTRTACDLSSVLSFESYLTLRSKIWDNSNSPGFYGYFLWQFM